MTRKAMWLHGVSNFGRASTVGTAGFSNAELLASGAEDLEPCIGLYRCRTKARQEKNVFHNSNDEF